MRRREVLTGGSVLVLPFAGCADYPPFKRVEFRENIEVERNDGSWEISTVAWVESNAGPIRGVRFVAFDADGNRTCEQSLGDFGERDGHWHEEPHVIAICDRFPHVITFATDESLCDEDVPLETEVMRWSGDGWTNAGDRECDEGLPPEETERTSAPKPTVTTDESASTTAENGSSTVRERRDEDETDGSASFAYGE